MAGGVGGKRDLCLQLLALQPALRFLSYRRLSAETSSDRSTTGKKPDSSQSAKQPYAKTLTRVSVLQLQQEEIALSKSPPLSAHPLLQSMPAMLQCLCKRDGNEGGPTFYYSYNCIQHQQTSLHTRILIKVTKTKLFTIQSLMG